VDRSLRSIGERTEFHTRQALRFHPKPLRNGFVRRTFRNRHSRRIPLQLCDTIRAVIAASYCLRGNGSLHGEVEYLWVKPRVRDLLQDALGCIVGLGLRPRGQNQLGALAGQRKRRLKKRVFGNSRCVSSVIREYSEEPLHTGQTLPAWTSSIGPLRNARVTIAFASLASSASSVFITPLLYRWCLPGCTGRRCAIYLPVFRILKVALPKCESVTFCPPDGLAGTLR